MLCYNMWLNAYAIIVYHRDFYLNMVIAQWNYWECPVIYGHALCYVVWNVKNQFKFMVDDMENHFLCKHNLWMNGKT